MAASELMKLCASSHHNLQYRDGYKAWVTDVKEKDV